MLDEYMKDFEQRNPNLKVFNSVLHLDESTPHLHIDFVPVAHKGKRGLPLKNSMSGALREQGFSSSNRMQNEWTAWADSERSFMDQILHKHGISHKDKNVHRNHMTVDEYKQFAQKSEELKKLNAQITELKKKTDTEFTAEDAALFNNQNDFLRSKIIELGQTIEKLCRQVNARFVPVSIFNPDKLQYMADGLARANIPYVAESNTVYIPDYAWKTAQEILKHYKPSENAVSIREQIALDIDRLVCSSIGVEDLLVKLQERGYEVKQGKYVSVKHPDAERFIRLKTLGEDYVPKQLEQRIAGRENLTDNAKNALQAASSVERRFYVEVLEITVAVKEFRIEPKKQDKTKIYNFGNDERICYLADQLKTIAEFRLTSRESIYGKARELQKNISEIRSQGCNPAPEETKLKRVNELIKAYEAIVEGNYIDNLFKAQSPQQTKNHTHKR